MLFLTILFVVAAFFSGSTVGFGLNNGVALTPPMGWNPFNAFGCNTSEVQYRAAADALVRLSLKDLGYQYINADCGWQSNNRSPTGRFMWDSTRIPSGIPKLADYVHELDLLFGLNSDAGYYACDLAGGWEHWLGSKGNEQSDANTFAAWGVDYLKYDNCFVVSNTQFVDYSPSIDERPLFEPMRDALNSTGRHIVYAVNEWGSQDPARWDDPVANTWRISNNIGPSFADLRRIINQLAAITSYAGPGGFNDLDLLEVGNPGLTEAEWKMHFAFWAAAKSPLIISTDLTAISKEALNILSNKAVIDVNQDALGLSVSFKRRYTDDYDVWAGPLKDGSTVVVLLNWMNESQSITFNLSDVGLASAYLTDLWGGTSIGNIQGSYTAAAEAHGILLYKLTMGVAATPFQFSAPYMASSPTNGLSGGATTRSVDSSGHEVVSNIGKGGTLTFTNIDAGDTGGTRLLSLTYINADWNVFNTDCPNCRRALVSVNGRTPVPVEMPISGQSWELLFEDYLVCLDGFSPGGENNITFENPDAWAPDMYFLRIA